MTEWRTLDWLPEHEISETGGMRRVTRSCNRPAGYELKGSASAKGYWQYTLKVGDRLRTILGHRLVCEAWHGPPPFAGAQAAHGDGNPANNHWGNLRWATHAENQADKRLHGTVTQGEKHPRAKLTSEQVRQIRAGGERTCALAARLGVSRRTIYEIRSGITWKAA